jgi:hypothetical protein
MPNVPYPPKPDWFLLNSALKFAEDTFHNEGTLVPDVGVAGFSAALSALGAIFVTYAGASPRRFSISVDCEPATEANQAASLKFTFSPVPINLDAKGDAP